MDIRLEADLLRGKNHIFEDGIEIINYSLDKIYSSIGVDEYYTCLGIINFDKNYYLKKGYEGVEIDYYILCYTIQFLEMFIKCKEVKYHSIECKYMIYLEDDEFVWVDNDKLKNIFNVAKEMYCIADPDLKKDDIIFENDEVAKKFAEFFEAEKNMGEDVKKDVVTMNSIIEYVSNKHNSLNLSNIWHLTVWQLYRSYTRLEMITDYHKTLDGIYSGNIDSKNINLQKIRADKVIV